MLEPYSLVELLTDNSQDRGVSAGAVGTILEVYDDATYEVEFSREDGTPIAWFAVPHNQVNPCVEQNLVSSPSERESA